MKKHGRPEIPRKTIYRLSIYLRCLQRLRQNGLETVSSEALARAAMLARNKDGMKVYLLQAQKLSEKVADAEAKALLLTDLSTIA